MIIRPAHEDDMPGLIALTAQVEHWFGPMTSDPGFRAALAGHVSRGTALIAVPGTDPSSELVGGLLFSPKPPAYHVRWLVVAEQARGTGIGRALMTDAVHRFVTVPGTLEGPGNDRWPARLAPASAAPCQLARDLSFQVGRHVPWQGTTTCRSRN